jgi:uncharacterized protein (TIGR02611 family)
LLRQLRKAGVFVVGWFIVVAGLLLVPLPGPGWLIVFVGLSLLATEFVWAVRLQAWVRQQLTAGVNRIRLWRTRA